MAKKTIVDTSEFDEQAMMHEISQYGEAMAQGNYKIPESPPASEVDSQEEVAVIARRKRGKSGINYKERFLLTLDDATREYRHIVIRAEYHYRLSSLLAAMKVVKQKDKTTIAGYIDNILTLHFDTHQDEINELYGELTGGGKLY